MHNGYIADFAKIKRKMCEAMRQEAYEHIQGGTDTEHFAALLMSYLCPTETKTTSNPYAGEEGEGAVPASWEGYHTPDEMKEALFKTIATIVTIQSEFLGEKAQPNE
jgi:glutamine amidotransferase